MTIKDWRLSSIAGLVTLVAEQLPDGVKRLEGGAPEPDWVGFLEALEGTPENVHVQRSRGLTEAERRVFTMDKVEELLYQCGGWQEILEAIRWYRRVFPLDWRIYTSYIRVRSFPRSSLSVGMTVATLCERLGVDRKTVIARRKLVPEAIATAVIDPDIRDMADVEPENLKKPQT